MDSQYAELARPAGGVRHEYGSRVQLLSHPFAMSLLAELCSPDTHQPRVNQLVERLYDWMTSEVVSRFFSTSHQKVATRMEAMHPEGVYEGSLVDREQPAVVVDIARAGILPSLRLYDGLNHVLNPARVRLDHIIASRTTNEEGKVTGVTMDLRKIGGPVDDAVVLLPDPMGATGSSIARVIEHYSSEVPGTPRLVVAMHLIITPEYLANILRRFPAVHVVAIRLDRGLSPPDVLACPPGQRWSEERGLNDKQYIVPGGGGLGEVMNNSWI